MTTKKRLENKLLIGRNEWVTLPHLKIPAVKAKIDTGAKTSSLHALNIKTKTINNIEFVLFDVYPIQGKEHIKLHCKAPIHDQRLIMSSNGLKEDRYVIKTELHIADESWEIEMTLSNRDPLRYRMLLGREALKGRVLIDPDKYCLQRKILRKKLEEIYTK